ncbi:MAG: FKBP-type peptidyl-prolyl cis-trans isomerase [Rhodanobacteraceae bacterium]
MQIADRSVASFHYTLTNDSGDVIDSSRAREPLAYLHGAGNIVPGLEKALAGREAGDAFKVDVEPQQGYGPRHEEMLQTMPKSAFQGVPEVKPGMQFQANGPQGAVLITVAAVDGDTVSVDGNHPLAGQNLHFDVEVTEVREATEEELTHGHVHGAGGDEH